MDPYLETSPFWSDVHQSLITYLRDALQPAIMPRYNARIDERIYLTQEREPFLEVIYTLVFRK